jgi:hypothetical protein
MAVLMRTMGCAIALMACVELEAGRSHFPDQDAGTPPDMVVLGDGGPAVDGGARLDNPVGQWALFVEDRKCMSAIGAVIESVIWSWYLVDLIEVGEAGEGQILRKRVRLCEQQLSPLVGGLRTFVPEAVVDSVPTLDMSGFLLGPNPGDDYLGAEFVAYWGMQDIGIEAEVPTEIDDPRLVDQDGDGHPGVSFITANSLGEPICDVRVAQRTRIRLDGKVDSAIRLSGSVWGRLNQSVLLSSSPLCATDTRFAPSPSPSRFIMLRIDGRQGAAIDVDLDESGAIDCTELRDAVSVVEAMGGVERIEPDASVCQ